MRRRFAIAVIAALGAAALGGGAWWAVVAARGPGEPRDATAGSGSGGGAMPTLAGTRPLPDGAAPPAASVIAAEIPLVPEVLSSAPASAIRRATGADLWAQPSNRIGADFAKFPPDGLPRGTAVLLVTVVDAAGVFVKDAGVRLTPPARPGRHGSWHDKHWLGRTDAAGALRVAGLPSGPVVAAVYGSWSDSEHPDAVRDVVLVADRSTSLSVRLDRDVPQTGSVVGRVVDDGGGPLADAYVVYVAADNFTRTDELGRFRLDDLPAGLVTISAQPDGCSDTQIDIEVKPRTEASVELRAKYEDPGPRTIRGRVIGPQGEAVPGADVWLRRHTDRFPFRRAIADAGGTFVLRGLSDALLDQTVSVSASAWDLGYDREEIDVGGGAPAPDVTVALKVRRATLSVRVLDVATALPVRKCLAIAGNESALERGDGVLLKPTERDGPLEGRVEAGSCRLVVETPEFAKWEGTVVVAPPPARTTAPDIRLVRLRPPVEDVFLTVVVNFEPGGREYPGIQVEVLDPLDSSPISEARIGTEDRHYTLAAYTGDWRLRVTASGYETLDRLLRIPSTAADATLTVRLRPK